MAPLLGLSRHISTTGLRNLFIGSGSTRSLHGFGLVDVDPRSHWATLTQIGSVCPRRSENGWSLAAKSSTWWENSDGLSYGEPRFRAGQGIT